MKFRYFLFYNDYSWFEKQSQKLLTNFMRLLFKSSRVAAPSLPSLATLLTTKLFYIKYKIKNIHETVLHMHHRMAVLKLLGTRKDIICRNSCK